MDKEIKDKWVAALRSGEYTQGRSYLRRKDDKFCCLGVLCDVAKDKYNLSWAIQTFEITGFSSFGIFNPNFMISPNTETIPIPVLHLLGLSTADSSILMRMNDEEDKNFNEIADYIERCVE